MGELFHFIVHEDDIRRVNGDIRSDASHGNADVSRPEGRCVIDAVPDHADPAAPFLIFPDAADLVFRHTGCAEIIYASLRGDGGGSPGIVAGEERRLHIQSAKFVYRPSAFFPHRVSENDHTGVLSVYSSENGSAAFPEEIFRLQFRLLRYFYIVSGEKFPVPCEHSMIFNKPADPLAWEHAETGSRCRSDVPFLCTQDNRLAQRML